VFSTAADNQPEVEVHVLQGERQMAGDNKSLGKFNLTDIPPAPRGVPQVEVTFDIDANGLVHVSAKDLGTGKEQSMTITGGSALPKDDIEQMIKDAEAHASEDATRRERAELVNQADSLVWQTDKALKEFGDKVDASTTASIEEAVRAVRELLQADDVDIDALKAAMETLGSQSHEMSQAVYAASTAEGEGMPGDASSSPDQDDADIVDAEIVDEGDDQDAAG
jgi:molecular chaperone DnaK